MKAVQFHVTFLLRDANVPYQSPEIQAGIIAEVLKHRSPHLFGGGGAMEVQVTPDAQRKENNVISPAR